jgi:hypothetical protein
MTALCDLRLVCRAPDTVVSPANGSAPRTFELAASVRSHLAGVAIRAFSAAPAPFGLDGLDIVHIPRPVAGLARVRYPAGALLVDTPRELAASVQRLHADPRARAALGAAVPALVEARYDRRTHVPRPSSVPATPFR